MKSILVIAGFAESLLNFRSELLDAFVNEGITVHVAAPDIPVNSYLRSRLEAKGVHVHCIRLHRTGLNPFKDIVTLQDIRSLIAQIQPDCVFAYTVKPVIYGLLAAKFAGVPKRVALITGLGYAFAGEANGLRAWLRRLVRVLYGAALRGATKIFFQNPDDRDLFRKLGITGLHSPVTVVNGSGINVSHFVVHPQPKGTTNFLLIARILGDKGIREYVQAATHIRAKYPSAQFTLVGWIDDNPDAICKSEVDAWVTQGAINYLGKLDDVRPAIADANVYVLPSYREGTPRTVLEAMAMGRAIITTDAPGCRETVVDGENGFLVSVKSVKELVDAMEKFIVDPDLAARMGISSRHMAEEKYDVHRVNALMLKEMGI